ncbi:MAG: family 1 glycosylhydrolase [Desulfosudis oleivorans]|nr:family 1 glycosylhydrolase [Desulfosudis oleivorans]
MWDRFSHTPGKDHQTATQATSPATIITVIRMTSPSCASIGLKAYRFSVSWPRVILPGGRGRVNPSGLDFYDRLVDALAAPQTSNRSLTLYHWDLPQALQDEGGWDNREIPAMPLPITPHVMVKRLGDRREILDDVQRAGCHRLRRQSWSANTPRAFKTRKWHSRWRINLMVAHGLAVQAIRAANPSLAGGYRAEPVERGPRQR